MAARLPWILAALALGVALLAAALWRDGAPRATAAALDRESVEPRAEVAGPELREPTEPLEPVERAALARAPQAPRPAAGAKSEPPVDRHVKRVVVRGRVRADVPDLERTRLELARGTGRSRRAVEARCAGDGSFEIEGISLFDHMLQQSAAESLELRVAHPDCLERVTTLVLGKYASSEPSDDTVFFRWSAGTTVCELVIALDLGARVRGTLAGTDEPERHVVAVALEHDGQPAPPWLACAAPDEHGRFELLLARGRRYAVVVAARDTRPALSWLDLQHAHEREIVLRPEPGAELSGVVRMAPGLRSYGIRVELQLAREPDASAPRPWPRPAPDFDELVWLDGAFEWRLRSSRADADGSFRFTGLAPREYELRALGVGVPGEELRAWPVARLRAPAAGLALGPVLASLDLDLGPLEDGPLAFHLVDERETLSRRLGPYRTDARGLAQVHLPPGRDYEVFVEAHSLGRISTPAAGEFASFLLPLGR